MAVLGVVAEFNPFHQGHLYFIKEIKKQNNINFVICVMSGNFVQRGTPAICNKWARAAMAVQSGADLVIELPFCFATRSAYNFAQGAIQLLERTGIVSHLGFGSESNDIGFLNHLANLLNEETEAYQGLLKKYLAQGLSYPVARAQALQEYYPHPSMKSFLLGSNNILGIEYLKVLQQINSNIIPLAIQRKGSHYHSSDLDEYASASAIREALYNNISLENIQHTMPATARQILLEEINQGRAPIRLDILENILMYRLRMMSIDEIGLLYDVNEGLENRIYEKSLTCTDNESLKNEIKTKRYSLTKINRILLYSIFNFNKIIADELDKSGPLYHHVLAFNRQGQKLLQAIKENSPLPVLSRGKDVKMIWDQKYSLAGKMIDLDVKATNVYSLMYPDYIHRTGAADFTTSPVLHL